MKKQIYLFLKILLLTACSSGNDGSIRLALDWTYNTNHIGILVAQEKGYYRQEGLDVNLIELGKTSATTLLVAQQVELSLSSQGDFIFSKNEGAPLVSLASLLQHNPTGFYSLKKSGILSPKDLQGKVYGGWGSMMEEAIIRSLIRLGGETQPQFENRMIGSMNIRSALSSVDFIWGYQGWQGAQLDIENIEYHFLPVAKYIPALDDYSPILIANRNSSFYKNHPEKISKFIRATAQGYVWAVNHPLESQQILLKYDTTLNPALIEKSLTILLPNILDSKGRWGYQEESRYKEYIHFAFQNHLVKELSTEGMIDNQYLESL